MLYENENANENTTTEQAETFICARCGAVEPVYKHMTYGDKLNRFETHDGDCVCTDCLDAYEQCDCCGEWFLKDDDVLTHTANGDNVCEDCLDEEYMQCDDCGEWYPRDDVYEVHINYRNSKFVCEDCLETTDNWGRPLYYHCECCEDWFVSNYMWHTGNINICEDCCDGYVECADCGDAVAAEDAVYIECEDSYYCPYCASRHESDETTNVDAYGYAPDLRFGTTDGNDGRYYYEGTAYTFGVELECDGDTCGNDTIDAVRNLTDRLYVCHDGSLSTHGFEIISHPATLSYHRECFPWKAICKTVLDDGFRSHDTSTCGLHVHIGRDQMSNSNEVAAKMALVMARHKKAFVRFSRRKSDLHWCEYLDLNDYKVQDALYLDSESSILDALYRYSTLTRYRAVNVNNDATLEVRIFRGSLKYDTVLASIELVSNLVGYCDHHSLDECLQSTWDDIVGYESFPELTDYCSERMADFTYKPVTITHGAIETPTENTDNTDYRASENGNIWGGTVQTEDIALDENLPEGTLVYDCAERRFGLVYTNCPAAMGIVTGVWFGSTQDVWRTDSDLDRDNMHGWNAARNTLRRVTKINGFPISDSTGRHMLFVYKETGILPGDHVTCAICGDATFHCTVMTSYTRIATIGYDPNVLGLRIEDGDFNGHDLDNLLPAGSTNGWFMGAASVTRESRV